MKEALDKAAMEKALQQKTKDEEEARRKAIAEKSKLKPRDEYEATVFDMIDEGSE